MVALAEPKTWRKASTRTSSSPRSHPHNPESAYPRFSSATSGLRFYFPEISRWLSRDPIGEQGGLNLYAYVGNSCIHNIDPIVQRSWTRENYAGPALLNNNRMDFIIWIKHNFPDDRPLASAQWWQLFTIKWEYVLLLQEN